MRFDVSTRLTYQLATPATFLFNLQAWAGSGQVIEQENLRINREAAVEEVRAAAGRFLRVDAPGSGDLTVDYTARVRTRITSMPARELAPTTAAPHAGELLPFLFPSRYCQSDLVGRFAWQTFGQLATPFEQATAICDWIHTKVSYVRGTTHASTSAADTLLERAGVCRDFAHLGIALCRALNLPARYATGYAAQLEPPDLHAWFEVAIGGRWIVFDATQLAPLNGLVRVGHGRDAADVAVATIFGPATFARMDVRCEPAAGERFEPWPTGTRSEHAAVAGPAGPGAVEEAA